MKFDKMEQFCPFAIPNRIADFLEFENPHDDCSFLRVIDSCHELLLAGGAKLVFIESEMVYAIRPHAADCRDGIKAIETAVELWLNDYQEF